MRRIDPAAVVADICRGVEAPQTVQAPTYSATLASRQSVR
jgi:MoxR-like ATPase